MSTSRANMPASSPGVPPPRRSRAFTLIDLMIAVVVVGLLAAVAMPSYSAIMERVKVAEAKADLFELQTAIERFRMMNNHYALPASLAELGISMIDPWGSPYRYLNIEAGAKIGSVRKDRNLVPLNSDYDLYSAGKDGQTRPPLTARHSRDDILRANNGSFLGLAEDY